MTIMTTTFIPCGAKLPIIALIAGALFGRGLVGSAQRLFRRDSGHCHIRHHAQKNPDVRRGSALRHGAAGYTCPTVGNVLLRCGNAAGPSLKKQGPLSCSPRSCSGSFRLSAGTAASAWWRIQPHFHSGRDQDGHRL